MKKKFRVKNNIVMQIPAHHVRTALLSWYIVIFGTTENKLICNTFCDELIITLHGCGERYIGNA